MVRMRMGEQDAGQRFAESADPRGNVTALREGALGVDQDDAAGRLDEIAVHRPDTGPGVAMNADAVGVHGGSFLAGDRSVAAGSALPVLHAGRHGYCGFCHFSKGMAGPAPGALHADPRLGWKSLRWRDRIVLPDAAREPAPCPPPITARQERAGTARGAQSCGADIDPAGCPTGRTVTDRDKP